MRVCMNGWGNIPTGLGTELRWLWKLLPFTAWYQAQYDNYRNPLGFGDPLPSDDRGIFREGEDWDGVSIEADVVVGVERFCPHGLIQRMKADGVRLVVLANPESNGAVKAWKRHADLVIARTDQAAAHFRSIGIECVRRDAVVDSSEFRFRERAQVRSAVFTNGWGGTHLRKGLPEVEQILALDPTAVEVYSQRPLDIPHKGFQSDPARIYNAADLIFMPSRFEGLGLTLLEAMASGCLVAATDAEPMRSFLRAAYGPDADLLLLPVASTNEVVISGQRWPAAYVDPAGALDVVHRARAMDETTVLRLSRAGRDYVERVHGRQAVAALISDFWRTP